MKMIVFGAGGFIGGHLVEYLLEHGHDVYGIDIKNHEYTNLEKLGCKFTVGDLREYSVCEKILKDVKPDQVYQLAADMGGAGFIFTGENDSDIMHNSVTINLNILSAITNLKISPKIFYSSSACIYPEHNQLDPNNPVCAESSAYPAAPDSEYGWEKLFSERLFLTYAKNKNLNVRIARFHNIFGPFGTWRGGREKAPAALCRKIAEARSGDSIQMWGDGKQTRSFLYIDECIKGIVNLMQSDCTEPLNIGSDEMVTINQLAEMIIKLSNKKLDIEHIDGPQGVRGRCSDNALIYEKLKWKPSEKLCVGLEKTYKWILDEHIKCLDV